MIQINNQLRIIKIDDNNLELQQLITVQGKKNGKHQIWKGCGYYSDLKQSLKAALNKQLFDIADDEITLQELIHRIDMAEQNIIKSIQK